VETKIQTPSLLPYLKSVKNNFGLDISLVSEEYEFLEKTAFPFLVICDSGSFTRVIDARIVTDAESVIKPVFLLLQSDQYHLTSDGMWPLNNMDIDRLWQQVFLQYSAQTPDESPHKPHFVLLRQINKKGGLSPFQSLFYCTFRKDYFHPPCSKCGKSLDLCRDDHLLSESELQPYSSSLKRYLYCPECTQDPNLKDFYVFSLDAFDPPDLKNHLDLIKNWEHLIVNPITVDHFPCLDCADQARCFGNDKLAVSRIVPFSFYPFYLMILEAATLNAHDFLSLISGATQDEIKDNLSGKRALGRVKYLEAAQQKLSVRSPFLFDSNHEKNPLEILYLKLSFLGQLAQMILSNWAPLSHPGLSHSLERIWVKLARQGSLLPLFWNFNIDVIDIGINLANSPHLSVSPPNHGLHFLGNAWFYTLLVNDHQGAKKVLSELEKLMVESTSTKMGLSELIKKNEANPVFAAKNIFWRPKDRHVNKDWQRLWEESLELGGELLEAGMNRETSWSENKFWQDFEALREKVKAALFGQDSFIPKAPSQSDDQAISALLNEIAVRWRLEIKNRKDRKELGEIEQTLDLSSMPETTCESPKEITNKNKETIETVILRPDKAGKQDTYSPNRKDPEETLILSTESHSASDLTDQTLQDEGGIQETVILGSDDFKRERTPSEPITEAVSGDDLPETVILPSGKKDVDYSDASLAQNSTEHISTTKETLNAAPEQVRKKKTTQAEKKDALNDEDFLTETVILKTNKDKDKESEHE
jgi:hypothetical protein